MNFLYNPYRKAKEQIKEIALLQNKIGSLNVLNKHLTKQIETCRDKKIVEKLMELDNPKVLMNKVTRTKFNEKVVVYIEKAMSEQRYNLYVVGFDKRSTLVTKTTLFFMLYKSSSDNHLTIKIEDIQNFPTRGNGFGSVAMALLLDFAKQKEVSKIIGDLKPTDITNDEERTRRVHFYQTKFGFTISWLNDLKNEGSIYLNFSAGLPLNTCHT